MYEEYWKLKEKPFQNNFDLRFLYLSLQHEEAVTRLMYAARDRRHGVIITGEYGSGKSLILQYFLKRIVRVEPSFRVIHIGDPLMQMIDFYREFLNQLGAGPDSGSRFRMASTLENALTAVHDSGGHTIVAIDEADLVQQNTMEEMRILLDLCHPKTQQALLTVILCGRLREGEKGGALQSPAVRQRIPISCKLDRLSEEQCSEYIQHRLQIAGQPNFIFTDEAIRLISERSSGAPRSINNICDLGLFLGCSRRAVKVDAEIVEMVTQEIAGSLA